MSSSRDTGTHGALVRFLLSHGFALAEKEFERRGTSGVVQLVQRLSGRGGVVHVVKSMRVDPALGEHDRECVLAEFCREVYIMCAMSHPHVMAPCAWDVSVACNTVSYVMRWGCPLTEFLTPYTVDMCRGVLGHARLPRRFAYEVAVLIIRDVAGALAHMHARGFTHFDIKPANIVLVPQGGTSRVMPTVVDFTCAAMSACGSDGSRSSLRQSSVALLTHVSPWYRAPEMYAGVVRCGRRAGVVTEGGTGGAALADITAHVTPAVDVWALGVVLFELLFGVVPIAYDPAAPALTVLEIHATKLPPSASALASPVYAHVREKVAAAAGPPCDAAWAKLIEAVPPAKRAEAVALFNGMFEWDPARRLCAAAVRDMLHAAYGDCAIEKRALPRSDLLERYSC